MEKWKAVVGYEQVYEVSDEGRVKSLARTVEHGCGQKRLKERILSPGRMDKAGHQNVRLCQDGLGKSRTIHQLVLEAFVSQKPQGMECRHLNGKAWDNRLCNLVWGTHKENMKDIVRHGTETGAKGVLNGRNKYTEEQVREARKMLSNGISQVEIANRMNVSKIFVWKISNGRSWKHIKI